MESASRDAATPATVAQALRNIRKLRRRYWVASALGVPAIVGLGLVWHIFNLPSRSAATVASLTLDVASLTLHDDGVRSSFTGYLWARASIVASACAQTSTPTVMSNVPLQLTGD